MFFDGCGEGSVGGAMGDGLDIAAVETLMPVDTSAGIAAIRPTRSNLISAPDELL